MLSGDPVKVARSVGLCYVSDNKPGIRRERIGEEFIYLDTEGKPVTDAEELARIQALVIPPAWTEVWICPLPNGHLQATGRDAKNRKQYRYHANWCQIRNQSKFDRMVQFGLTLPLIREQTDRHLRFRTLCREKVLATLVQLLEKTLIRVGNTEYAEKNESYGLTTLQDDHVEVTATKVKFQFRGKSGVEHEIELGDRRLAAIVKRCQEIPGQELFQYYDENGDAQVVGSKDVNAYLREITGEDFTAKDFRTWFGTVYALLELREAGAAASKTEAKKVVTQAIKHAAKQLGNRPATCRKYYVHPAILEAYMDGSLLPIVEQCHQQPVSHSSYGLRPEEQAVLSILEQGTELKAA